MKLTQRTTRLIITITVGVLLLIFFHYTKLLRPIESAFTFVLTPVQGVVFNLSNSINNWYKKRLSYDDLLFDNKVLEERVSSLYVDVVQLEELQRENEALKELLKTQDDFNTEMRVASIIGRTIDGIQNTYLLNKGRQHGIDVGYPVVVYDGVLVGKIIKVHEQTSIVRLVTDNASKIAATITNEDATIGLAQGQQNNNMVMNLIPQSEVIFEETMVITSGIEENIPRGLLLGVIDTQITQGGDLFKSAIIRPIVAYDRIVEVGVIIPKK